MEIDWNIPDEVWKENEEFGWAAQVHSAQLHWAEQCQRLGVYGMLDLYKRLTDDFYDARWGQQYCGSSGDTVSWLDRKRLAVVMAIGAKLTEDIDRRAEEEFDRRCQGTDQELDRNRQRADKQLLDVDKVLADLEAKAKELDV